MTNEAEGTKETMDAGATEIPTDRSHGRGLVVISSCGHAGIINTARQAMRVSGVKKLHAALGGFHLFPAPDDYVRTTVAEFKALDPDVIIPMHCSGPNLVALLRTELADRVITSATGTEYAFGA